MQEIKMTPVKEHNKKFSDNPHMIIKDDKGVPIEQGYVVADNIGIRHFYFSSKKTAQEFIDKLK